MTFTVLLKNRVTKKERDTEFGGVMEQGFFLSLSGFREGGLSYISFQHLTIVWLSRGCEGYIVTRRLLLLKLTNHQCMGKFLQVICKLESNT